MDPSKNKDLERKRQSSRISSMRHHERQRNRRDSLTSLRNDLQKKNEALRHENQMLRTIISSLKANNKNSVVSEVSTRNASPISALLPRLTPHDDQQLPQPLVPMLQALQTIQQQPQQQQQEVPREPTALDDQQPIQTLAHMQQAFHNVQQHSQYQQQALPREPTTLDDQQFLQKLTLVLEALQNIQQKSQHPHHEFPTREPTSLDGQQLLQTLALVLEALQNIQQKSQHRQQVVPTAPTNLNGQQHLQQLALLLQAIQDLRQQPQQDLPTSPLLPIEQQHNQVFAPLLQAILNVQQEQQGQQQRCYQPISVFSSMGHPPPHQLPSSHLPPIQNSIIQSTLPTLSLAGSGQNPNTSIADPSSLQSSLNVLQCHSNLRQNLAGGSAFGAQAFVPQVQQQTLINFILGSEQSLPSSTVSASDDGKDNRAGNLNDGASSEQSFSGHIFRQVRK
eukprot:scaffold918_cov126-Cylindrotheca_fusiformis.AAC.2